MENEKDRDEEYTFVRETIKEQPPLILRFLLKVLKVLGMGVVFGIGVCIVLFIFGKNISDIFTGNEEENESKTMTQAEDDTTMEEPSSEELPELTPEQRIDNMLAYINVLFYENEDDDSQPGDGDNNETETEVTVGLSDTLEVLHETGESDSRENIDEEPEIEPEPDTSLTDENPDEETVERRKLVGQFSYTGLIVNKKSDVYILTAYDAIKDGDEIQAALYDGQVLQAEIFGISETNNIAILRVKRTDIDPAVYAGIQAAEFVPMDELAGGMKVVYAGDPYEVGRLIYSGNLAGVDHDNQMYDFSYSVAITDFNNNGVNDGFIFDGNGNAVAIVETPQNESTYAGNISGICLADIEYIIDSIVGRRKINHIGIMGDTVTDTIREWTGENIPDGMYVTDVDRESAAYKAGIMVGDIITMVNSNVVTGLKDIQEILQNVSNDSTLTIVIKRKVGTSYNEFTIRVQVESY